jgi:hypothetical protein
MIGRSVAALGILALMGPAALQAQIGLASGAARIGLIARVPPRASIDGVSAARNTVQRGNLTEETVKVHLSANTGYRLVVVGTAPASSGTPATLWVRGESGRFEKVKPGAAITVIRARHGPAECEPEVTFHREGAESVEGLHFLPVRYEIRIDPAI